MVKSMTGFGKGEAALRNKKITVEIRSLNSKQLDLSLRLPAVYRQSEYEIRNLIARTIQRGKVDVFVTVESQAVETSARINREVFREYLRQMNDTLSFSGIDAGYDAILPFRTVRTDGRCPYTPNWHGVAALYAGTQAIFKEGMDAAFARHEVVAAQCRAGLAELGIKLWTAPDAVNAPTVTAAMIPDGFTWPEWKEALRRHGLICTGSFGPMDGKVFRLGHMGTQAQPYLMEQALDAIAATLGK